MTSLAQVRQQLIDAREELQRECADLQAQLSAKSRRLDALNILLAEEAPSSQNLFPMQEEAEELNLTAKAKEILKGMGSAGARPRDITRRLKQMDMDAKNTFASNFLWRMKNKTREAVEYQGRYYWKGFEPENQEAPGGAS